MKQEELHNILNTINSIKSDDDRVYWDDAGYLPNLEFTEATEAFYGVADSWKWGTVEVRVIQLDPETYIGIRFIQCQEGTQSAETWKPLISLLVNT